MSRIPKAEHVLHAAMQFQAMAPCGTADEGGPASIRAWWVILNAAWRLAARCASEDGDLAAVEREGERVYRMLAGLAGTEEIIAEEKGEAKPRSVQ